MKRRDPTQRNRDIEVLVLCSLVVLAAYLLEVQSDERVGIVPLGGWSLPGLCMSREVFGLECPGCGLTRSFIHLAHGEFVASIRSHRIGPLFAILVLIQLPYRAWSLWLADRKWPSPRVCQWIATSLIALLVSNWLLGMFL
jgi:hypothetical protein